MIESILAALGLNKASVVTGAVGAAVAALQREKRSKTERVMDFTVGFFVAAWGAGAVIEVFGVSNTPTFQGALGFTLGYLGMSLAGKAREAVAALNLADFIPGRKG